MEIELHCHSHHSKGRSLPVEGIPSPQEVVKHAKSIGLGGVAITDHNTIKGWDEARKEAKKQGILFIPGLEIDTKRGHILALGITEHVRAGLDVGETVDRIGEQGGISIAAHPFSIDDKGVKYEYNKADAVEVFNSLALDRFANSFTSWVTRGSGKPRVVGSDAHMLEMMGLSRNTIECHDLDSFLKQVKSGKVTYRRNYIPAKVIQDWARIRMERSEDAVWKKIEGYPHVKRWFAQGMARKYYQGEAYKWLLLARFAMFVSAMYSPLKIFKYI